MVHRVRIALPRALGGNGALVEVQPRAVIWSDAGRALREAEGAAEPVEDPFSAVTHELGRAGSGARAVGYVSYEYAARLDPLIRVPPGRPALPECWWAILEAGGASDVAHGGGAFSCLGPVSVSLDDDQFRTGVETIREGIAAGEYYQVNLTRRWCARLAGDPAGVFDVLRAGTPPRYACYLEDRALGWSVLCLSPELLLRTRDGRLETRPIKGTRPRPGDRVGEERARKELAFDPKERAELAMIVDLERNDLNRVCVPGSVRVVSAGRTTTTPDVLHREATVVGTVAMGYGPDEILTAMLPGGSISGAPKLAACAAIAELEPVPRTVYCGALGVIEAGGDMTLSLAIRTGYVAGGTLSFHSGCGIVWDSVPALEEAESRAKVRRWLELVGC